MMITKKDWFFLLKWFGYRITTQNPLKRFLKIFLLVKKEKMSSTLNCFVIMPITIPLNYSPIYNDDRDHFANVLKYLFTPALEKAGFNTISPKSSGSDIIHAEIITNLSNCELVLCDISTINPNVFFEFGIRCALNKPVALVKDDKTEKIPFDTGIINFHTYKSSPLWDKEKEIETLSIHIRESYKKSNEHNALWKYFGIRQSGEFSPGNTSMEEKLDYIIQKISFDNEPLLNQETHLFNLDDIEIRILNYISKGLSNHDIAAKLGYPDSAVKILVDNVFSKIGESSRTEATEFAKTYSRLKAYK